MRKSVLLVAVLLLAMSGSALADNHLVSFTVTIDNISGIGLYREYRCRRSSRRR